MEEPTVKYKVLKAVKELPHDATFEDVFERLYFLYKLTGLQAARLLRPSDMPGDARA